MIEYAYVDQCERLFEATRNELVRSARLREPGRMIVIVMCPGLFCALRLRNSGCRTEWAPSTTT